MKRKDVVVFVGDHTSGADDISEVCTSVAVSGDVCVGAIDADKQDRLLEWLNDLLSLVYCTLTKEEL